ncbi:LapA family protein [Brachybacterium huguangmaarense]
MSVPPDDRAPRPVDPADPVGYDAVPREDRHGADTRETTRRDEPAHERPATGRRGGVELPPAEPVRSGSRTAGIWIALILGAIVLVALLIFIVQNNVSAAFEYFGAQFNLPLGVAMLLAAIAGALVMALVGSVRMIQMSLELRRLRKERETVRRAVNGL